MKNSKILLFQFFILFIFKITKGLGLDDYLTIDKKCNFEFPKKDERPKEINNLCQEKGECEKVREIFENSENINQFPKDINMSILHLDDDNYKINFSFYIGDPVQVIKIEEISPKIINKLSIEGLNANIEFIELFSKENIILNFSYKDKFCKYHMKRIFWDKQTEYDFTIEIRDRKEAFEFGVFIFYKNKKEFLRKSKNYFTTLILEGEKKCGKTFITSKLSNNTKVALDYSLNTEGYSAIFEKNILLMDSEGIGTEKSNNLFNNTFNLFNEKNSLNGASTDEKFSNDLIEEHIEIQRNLLYQTFFRDSVRNIGNFFIMVQNQISLNSLNYLDEIVQKHMASESQKELRILVIYNYKDIDLISKIKRRIYNDILSRHKVQAIETNQKVNREVRAYEDLYYKLIGNSKIRITYLILGAIGKDSGNFFNEETFGYITSQAKNHLNYQIFNPIERLVENLNKIFKENINYANADQNNEYSDDEIRKLTCVELNNFGNTGKLSNLDRITFKNHPLCKSIWDSNVKESQRISYEIYYQKGLINFDIHLPFLQNFDEVEFTYIQFSKNYIGDVYRISIKANIHNKIETSVFERIDFIRQRKIKFFSIEEIIRLGYAFRNKKIANTCDITKQSGILKLKCPLID